MVRKGVTNNSTTLCTVGKFVITRNVYSSVKEYNYGTGNFEYILYYIYCVFLFFRNLRQLGPIFFGFSTPGYNDRSAVGHIFKNSFRGPENSINSVHMGCPKKVRSFWDIFTFEVIFGRLAVFFDLFAYKIFTHTKISQWVNCGPDLGWNVYFQPSISRLFIFFDE